MPQIIEEAPGLGALFGQGLSRGLSGESNSLVSQFGNAMKEKQQSAKTSEAIKRLTGKDVSGLPEDMQKAFLQQIMQGENQLQLEGMRSVNKASELQGKNQENIAPIQQGLQVVNKMRNLRSKGNLGYGSGFLGMFNPETRKDRGEYEQLGKSLISLATTIPIRNKLEFETLAEKLYDPSITDAEAEGVLDAMERILNGSLASFQQPDQQSQFLEQLNNPGMQQPQQPQRAQAGVKKRHISSF